jgi:hypothetical protein
MKPLPGFVVAILLCLFRTFVCVAASQVFAAEEYTIIVEVDSPSGSTRSNDESVARIDIDLYRLFPDSPAKHRIDLHSLRVVRRGDVQFPEHAQQQVPAGRPFRFYDAELLDEFPTWRRYASLEKLGGRPLFNMREKLPYGHRVFGAVGSHKRGTLVWPHTRNGDQLSVYEISFAIEPASKLTTSPPIGWVGDGGNRFARTSSLNGPPGNNSASVVDWNSDGLPDLLYGISSGYIVVAENTGTHETPAFDRRRIVFDSSGSPIDAGYDSSPLSVDWNGDGIRDLLVGAEKGCILHFQNIGTDESPVFKFAGFVEADGKMLLTPNWPIAELPNSKPGEVYPADYLAIPCVCDWDADGDQDLLAGGFVTGRIFLFENIGNKPDGTPSLRSRGPLMVKGEPLDVGWAAAPVAIDLDHDGDLDLVCGAKPQTAEGGDVSDRTRNIAFFENIGIRGEPDLSRRPLPVSAPHPTGTTVMVPVTDWNGDNLPDLFLITRGSMLVYPVPNIGTRTQPLFDMNSRPLKTTWNQQQIPAGTFTDWNHDGHPDLINRFHVSLNDGNGFPHSFGNRFSILAGGKPIRHPNPHGDENSYVTLHDLDDDGDHDCIYGAHSGHIWFHENRGTDAKPELDRTGYRLRMSSGALIQVGERPTDKEPVFNFTDLQGARPKPAPADFNHDGRTDLVIGDTYGRVRLYLNQGRDSDGQLIFAKPTPIHQSRSRLSLHAGDWDGDHFADVFVITGQRVDLFRNKAIPGKAQFDTPERLNLPPTIGGFYGVAPVDFNGDGDTDLVYHTSSRITCWVERSFLEHGYQTAKVLTTVISTLPDDK